MRAAGIPWARPGALRQPVAAHERSSAPTQFAIARTRAGFFGGMLPAACRSPLLQPPPPPPPPLFILEWKWSFVRQAPHRRAPLHAAPSACKALATRGGEKHVRARCGCTLHSARCARLTMRSWQAEQDRLEAKQQVCRSPPPRQLSRVCHSSGLPTCRPAQNAWGGRWTVLRTV